MKKIKEIYDDYQKVLFHHIKNFKQKIKKYINTIKNTLFNKKNRKKYLTVTGILIIANLLLINIFISYSYYHDKISFPILNTVVGNMYLEDFDNVLLVYLEDIDSTGNGNGKYHITNDIPISGYKYSGYKCQNDSTLVYNEETFTASVVSTQKDICSIYFDVIDNLDMSIRIMLESDVNSNNYIIGENIPVYGYQYSHYECVNNSELNYNSEFHSIKLTSEKKEFCSIYFTKQRADVVLTIYIEQTFDQGDYTENISIPSNIRYTLNNNKTICKNKDDERLDSLVIYENGYIIVKSSEVTTCEIYLNKNE